MKIRRYIPILLALIALNGCNAWNNLWDNPFDPKAKNLNWDIDSIALQIKPDNISIYWHYTNYNRFQFRSKIERKIDDQHWEYLTDENDYSSFTDSRTNQLLLVNEQIFYRFYAFSYDSTGEIINQTSQRDTAINLTRYKRDDLNFRCQPTPEGLLFNWQGKTNRVYYVYKKRQTDWELIKTLVNDSTCLIAEENTIVETKYGLLEFYADTLQTINYLQCE